MNYIEEMDRILLASTDIALSTSVNKMPNVRIVNFYYDLGKKGVIYFSTFRDNQKFLEFNENNNVAFTTIPHNEYAHVRVVGAKVSKSNLTIFDLKEEFSSKISGYDETIEQVGTMLDLYEISFNQATVTIDIENSEIVEF